VQRASSLMNQSHSFAQSLAVPPPSLNHSRTQAMAEKAEVAAGKLAKDAYSGAKHLAAATAAVSGMAENVLVHKAEAAAQVAMLVRNEPDVTQKSSVFSKKVTC